MLSVPILMCIIAVQLARSVVCRVYDVEKKMEMILKEALNYPLLIGIIGRHPESQRFWSTS